MSTFKLPVPPSTNNLFFNLPKGGRAPTGQYKQWQKEAGLLLQSQKARPIKGPVRIDMKVQDAGRFDLGNIEKPVTDILVKMGVIEGDHRAIVRGISLDWCDDVEGVQVRVTSMALIGGGDNQPVTGWNPPSVAGE